MIIQAFPSPIDLSLITTDEPLLPSVRTETVGGAAEIGGRSALMVLMMLIAAASWNRMQDLIGQPDPITVLDFLGELGAFCFAAMVCLLAMLRLKPVRQAGGWAPLASALGGAFVLTIINYLPATALPQPIKLASVLMLALGNLATVVCLAHLGRSFSVLPQARRLVCTGPYALVRHPLYVAEAVATIGMVLPHFGWMALGLVVTQFGLQYARILFEEAVLSEAFPAYAAYARLVPRFLPRLG